MSSASDLKIEGILIQVKEKLNEEHVKLWLPPYFTEDGGCCEEEMQKLMNKYSSGLGIDAVSCLAALKELQEHALDRLRERDHFRETGLATVKVRVPDENGGRRIISIQTKLSANVEEFQQSVAEQIGIESLRIKLIWSGKVLKPNSELGSQGVRNGTQLMAVIIHSNPKELQVADQAGNTLNLPPEEKKALVVAMSLHEKGRAALKRQDYALALWLKFEKHLQVNGCPLKDVIFRKQMAPHFGNEAVLFMRLHLLQAIVLFHQNKRQEAAKLLERARNELAVLKVDDHSLSTIMELGVERRRLGRCADGKQWVEPGFVKLLTSMGYSSDAARAALQQSNNNVSLSVQIIQEHPNLLNVASTSKFKITKDMLQQVVAVGFDPRMAKLALKRHRGDVAKAVEELIANGGIIDGERCTDDSDDSDEREPSAHRVQNDEKEREAYERLAEDMPTDEEDHLDLTLDLEETFLKEYQSLLSNP
ncbi:hypothetical protein C0J52_05786 [Blattella germanica]|nr:hypothetical protein C0J52_05786 [Blattella germanica]